MKIAATNPLLADWTTQFELPPFADISDDDFAAAFEAALTESRGKIQAIADNPEPPSFANTIEALERADKLLDRVAGVFYNVSGSDSNDAREALMRDLAPRMSAYASEITNNAALFARIRTLWEARETLDLTEEQQRVIQLAVFHGASHEKIAASTGMPLGTVKAHIRRGMIRLREILEVPGGGGGMRTEVSR